MKYAIGIVIEEWKITSGILNQHGNLIQQEIINTNVANVTEMIEHVVICVQRLFAHSSIPVRNIHGIGISIPDHTDQKQMGTCSICEKSSLLVEDIRAVLKVENIVMHHAHHMIAQMTDVKESNNLSTTMQELIGAGLCVLTK